MLAPKARIDPGLGWLSSQIPIIGAIACWIRRSCAGVVILPSRRAKCLAEAVGVTAEFNTESRATDFSNQ
jgi:hypothetical protein